MWSAKQQSHGFLLSIWIFRIILDIFRYIIYNRVRMLTEIEASMKPGYIDRGMLCLGMILK